MKIVSRRSVLFTLSLIGGCGFVYTAFSAPPGSPYIPGETIAPTCSPGDANCTVDTLNITATDTTTSGDLYISTYTHQLEPSANQDPNTTRGAFKAHTLVPATAVNDVEKLEGLAAFIENESTVNIGQMNGVIAWTHNKVNTTIGSINGGFSGSQHDAGSVFNLGAIDLWSGAYGGTVANHYGIDIALDNGGATVTDRYGIRINAFSGSATNDYGIRVVGASGDNLFYSYLGPGSSLFTTDPQGYISGAMNVFASLNSGANRFGPLLGVNEDNTTNLMNGVYGYVESTNASGTRGAAESMSADAYHSGAGTVSNLNAIAAWAGASAGTVTNLDTIHVRTPDNSGATITNNAGIRILNQSGIGVNNYALFYDGPSTSDVVVSADGSVGIGNSNPTYSLDILYANATPDDNGKFGIQVINNDSANAGAGSNHWPVGVRQKLNASGDYSSNAYTFLSGAEFAADYSGTISDTAGSSLVGLYGSAGFNGTASGSGWVETIGGFFTQQEIWEHLEPPST